MNRTFRENRSKFPADDLKQFRGSWVAFSRDGTQVVCSGKSLDKLEDNLLAIGQDPQQVVFEHIGGLEDDMFLGGAEFEQC